MQAIQMFNMCCAVAVVSGARDGEAPELNPGWIYRRKNSNSVVRLG